MVPERSNAAAGRILQEFEVVERPAAAGEAGEGALPASLLLVAMRKLYVCVAEGEVFFVGKLFQT